MSKLLQLWLAGLIGLGAAAIVFAPDSHVVQAGQAATNFISTTEKTAEGR